MKQLNDLNYLFALAAVTSDMRLSLSLSFNLMPTVRFKLNWRNFGFFVFTIKLLAALGSQLSFTVRESDGRCKLNTIHSLHSLHSFTCTHLAYTILSTHTLYSIPQQLLVYESFLRSGLNSALFEINWFLKPLSLNRNDDEILEIFVGNSILNFILRKIIIFCLGFVQSIYYGISVNKINVPNRNF